MTDADLLDARADPRQPFSKPDLPLQLSFRKGFFDAGIVLTVRNVSREQVAVIADFGGAAGGSESRRIVIPANGAREVGDSEGWAFTAGDSVTLKNAEYRDLTQTVPSL